MDHRAGNLGKAALSRKIHEFLNIHESFHLPPADATPDPSTHFKNCSVLNRFE